MKKIFTLSLFPLMLFALANCGDDSSTSANEVHNSNYSSVADINSIESSKDTASSSSSKDDSLSSTPESSSSSEIPQYQMEKKSSSSFVYVSSLCDFCEKASVKEFKIPMEIDNFENFFDVDSIKSPTLSREEYVSQYEAGTAAFDSRVIALAAQGSYIFSGKMNPLGKYFDNRQLTTVPDSLLGYFFPYSYKALKERKKDSCSYHILGVPRTTQPFAFIVTEIGTDTIKIANIVRKQNEGDMCYYENAVVSAAVLLELCDDNFPKGDFIMKYENLTSEVWTCSSNSPKMKSSQEIMRSDYLE